LDQAAAQALLQSSYFRVVQGGLPSLSLLVIELAFFSLHRMH
jgi:hypothetical protein